MTRLEPASVKVSFIWNEYVLVSVYTVVQGEDCCLPCTLTLLTILFTDNWHVLATLLWSVYYKYINEISSNVVKFGCAPFRTYRDPGSDAVGGLQEAAGDSARVSI